MAPNYCGTVGPSTVGIQLATTSTHNPHPSLNAPCAIIPGPSPVPEPLGSGENTASDTWNKGSVQHGLRYCPFLASDSAEQDGPRLRTNGSSIVWTAYVAPHPNHIVALLLRTWSVIPVPADNEFACQTQTVIVS